MIKIEFLNRTQAEKLRVNAKWFSPPLRAIANNLPKKALLRLKKANSLTVVMVGSDEGQKLNKDHRKKNYATDVLSFAPVEEGSLGQLVFCTPVIKSQAKEHKLKDQEELLYLFIHGVLHLLGYDHEKSDKAARVMYRLQDQIFDLLR